MVLPDKLNILCAALTLILFISYLFWRNFK
jgi:hypothetical protein